MWRRKDLKTQAKQALRLNYWKSILVSIILAAIVGGSSAAGAAAGAAGGSAGAASGLVSSQNAAAAQEGSIGEIPSFDIDFGIGGLEIDAAPEVDQSVTSSIEDLQNAIENMTPEDKEEGRIALIVILLIAGGLVLIGIIIAVLVSAFLINPVELGCRRFFFRNLQEKAKVAEVAFGYDNCYGNVVKTMFLRDLFLFFWALLFIIPAIIKSYSYRMVPYILAEHPDMPAKKVITKSRMMMKGNKWKAFILDLSFILWDILSLFTCGLLTLFYVRPYKYLTSAALYDALAHRGHKEDGRLDMMMPQDLVPQEQPYEPISEDAEY